MESNRRVIAYELECCLVKALEETGSELVLYQKGIIHEYLMKVYYLGYKNGLEGGRSINAD